jgi:hypothetical protein
MNALLKSSVQAMGFYHSEGFVPAWNQAARFTNGNGRIGTMLDIVDVRLNAGINDFPWNTYFTTLSAEYFGYSRGGNRILIVAHGIGPMATKDGILAAYRHEYADKSQGSRGGRISQGNFWALEDGVYGEVSIVEFDPILKRYEFPFMETLLSGAAIMEPLLLARLGPRAGEYIEHHRQMAREYHRREHGMDIEYPYIITMEDSSNCHYAVGGFSDHPLVYPNLDKGDGALAHLLSTGALMNLHHQSQYKVSSLANDIGCHGWWDGVRLLGIRGYGRVEEVHPGFGNVHQIVRKYWERLMIPATASSIGFRSLVQLPDGTWFTQYEKIGARMDTGEGEYRVTEIEQIGNTVRFSTPSYGSPFFKYDIQEVKRLKPTGANAYVFVSDPEPVGETHQADVQFYRIEADTSKRLMRAQQLENDFDLLMEFTAVE